MADRKHNRPRKVVDYSKFISQDSDDDDFSDHSYTRPAKKSKLPSSDSKTHNDTRSSKKISQELLVETKQTNRNKVEAKASSDGKENAKQPISAVLNEAKGDEIPVLGNSQPNKNDSSLLEFTKIVSVIDTDVSKPSIHKFGEGGAKKSNTILQELAIKDETTETDGKDDQNRIVLRNDETHASIKDQRCSTNNEISDSTKIACPVNMSQKSIPVRQSVMPKWKAPGPASQNSTKSGNEGCSKSFMGLRLGLSRNTRVKPLHANVKVQL